MSSVYVVPNAGEFDKLSETLTRSGAKFIAPTTLREFILETNGEAVVFASMPVEMLLILSRHAKQLVTEVPSVLLNVPGLFYQGEWMTLGQLFPTVDWLEMEKRLAKSGHTAFNVDALGSRDKGAMSETEEQLTKPSRLSGLQMIRQANDPSSFEEDIEDLYPITGM